MPTISKGLGMNGPTLLSFRLALAVLSAGAAGCQYDFDAPFARPDGLAATDASVPPVDAASDLEIRPDGSSDGPQEASDEPVGDAPGLDTLGPCEAGLFQCNGSVLEACDAVSGDWLPQQDCTEPRLCDAAMAACHPCLPGDVRYEPCGCDGGDRPSTCLEDYEWGPFGPCDPPACNGNGTCTAAGFCLCDQPFAGLTCDLCNEPEDYFDYPTCSHSPPQGACACESQPKPNYPICNDTICRVADSTCSGCGTQGATAFCGPCNVYPDCDVCGCDCACSPGTSLQRYCPDGSIQELTCTGRWAAWPACPLMAPSEPPTPDPWRNR